MRHSRWRLTTVELKRWSALHERGADVNGAAHLGMTGLYLAVIRGRVDGARWLLERGAQVAQREEFCLVRKDIFAGV
jgi:ankyrin repeat protein